VETKLFSGRFSLPLKGLMQVLNYQLWMQTSYSTVLLVTLHVWTSFLILCVSIWN